MSILRTRGLTKRFGGLTAVNNVNFDVQHHSITAVIGPNGAGKTTFFNTITGIYPPDEGSVCLQKKSLLGYKPDQITAMGISRTFQNIRLFGELSVLDNVLIGMHTRFKYGIFSALFNMPQARQEEEEAVSRAYELLAYMELDQDANRNARELPYGSQRLLEIARALAAKPKILLLDEPAAGMNPRETRELTELIIRIRDDFQLTIILIEHDMKLVMGISEHILVLDYGKAIAVGKPEDIRNNPAVVEAYLGKGAATPPTSPDETQKS
ncbi:ABC transporter ATP-binding protein [Pasteuria penetrans]|uniref:ABC transporter ATP-binding protein n=1 Tax=Pasteuria penetrans TaxID=86005 RepID=UPI000FA3AFD7|nr:ABC transporter ATP-binding protein [Pasteuria penetrans]